MINPYDGSFLEDDDDLFLAPLKAVSIDSTAAVSYEPIPKTPGKQTSLKRKASSPIDDLIPKKKRDGSPSSEKKSFGEMSEEIGSMTSNIASEMQPIVIPLPSFPTLQNSYLAPMEKEKKKKQQKTEKPEKEPKIPKRKDPVLPKAENKRDRPINRCVLTYDQIPTALKEYLEPKILLKPAHIYAKDESKGPYQGVTQFVSHGVRTGWGAQLQNKQRMQMIRIGTFDDIKVAAITFTAAYIDNELIDEPLKARDWIEDMCKDANNEVMEDWILFQKICQ